MEVEAKFRVSDADLLERLATAARLVGHDLEAPVARRDQDVFLDTADRRVLAAGFYLRRRENAQGVRIALKQMVDAHDDGVLRREEHELRVAADVPVADWPRGPLRARVRGMIGDEPVEPFLTLEQERRTRRVGLEGRAVAELSLDVVVVRAGAGARRWYEVELELLPDGGEEDLAVLSAALRDVWGLAPETRSKFERAMALTADETSADDRDGEATTERQGAPRPAGESEPRAADTVPATPPMDAGPVASATEAAGIAWSPDATEAQRRRPPIGSDHSMVEAAVTVMRLHYAKMLAHEQATRVGDDPEELHDMRVATRRLRMALRLFAGFLDAETMRPVLKGLRRTGRTLGAVRDLDVFHDKTERYIDTLPRARQGELEPLLAAWRVEYDARRSAMVTYLDGRRYRRFVESLDALLAGPPADLSASGARNGAAVRQVLPALLHRGLADVLAAGTLVDGAGVPLKRFHELRIAGKALRYTLEFFEAPLGRDCKPLIESMKVLQDHLGDLQDAVVSCGIVRDVLTWGSWAPPATGPPAHTDIVLAPGLGRYLVARQEEIERLVATFPEVWPRVAGEEFGGRLAALLAKL